MTFRSLDTVGSDQANKLLLVSSIAIARVIGSCLLVWHCVLHFCWFPWDQRGTALAVQWLRLHPACAAGVSLIPSLGTKIPHASQHSQKIKKKKKIEPIWLLIHYYLKAFLLHSTGVCGASLNYCVAQLVKNLPVMRETWVRSLGREDPWRRNGNPLQYSCLENARDRGAWWAPVQGSQELDTT